MQNWVYLKVLDLARSLVPVVTRVQNASTGGFVYAVRYPVEDF